MEISLIDTCNFIKSNESSFTDFFTAFQVAVPKLPKKHIVVQLSENLNTSADELSLFLNLAKDHKKNGMSFVVICSTIDIDLIPESLNVVPTLTEAKDVIEMEDIERDLGF